MSGCLHTALMCLTPETSPSWKYPKRQKELHPAVEQIQLMTAVKFVITFFSIHICPTHNSWLLYKLRIISTEVFLFCRPGIHSQHSHRIVSTFNVCLILSLFCQSNSGWLVWSNTKLFKWLWISQNNTMLYEQINWENIQVTALQHLLVTDSVMISGLAHWWHDLKALHWITSSVGGESRRGVQQPASFLLHNPSATNGGAPIHTLKVAVPSSWKEKRKEGPCRCFSISLSA